MKDDQLGIFEEAQRRTQHFASQSKALRRRILGGGPTSAGTTARAVNPFDLPARLPIPAKPPFWQLHAESRVRRRMRLGILRDDLDVNPLQIVQAVCAVAKLTAGQLLGRDQGRRVAWPRQAAIYLIARYVRELSLPQIAFIFSRDHTTIMHSIVAVPRRIEAGCDTTRELVGRVEGLLRTMAR